MRAAAFSFGGIILKLFNRAGKKFFTFSTFNAVKIKKGAAIRRLLSETPTVL